MDTFDMLLENSENIELKENYIYKFSNFDDVRDLTDYRQSISVKRNNYQYEKWNEILLTLLNREVFFSSYFNLNDPFEFTPFVTDKEFSQNKLNKELLINNAYISSFSTNKKSLLMWSHYARNHKGYCLVYKVNSTNNLFQVIYKKDRLKENINCNLNFKSEENIKNLSTYLRTKPKEWRYEKEYRLIYLSNDYNKLNKRWDSKRLVFQ